MAAKKKDNKKAAKGDTATATARHGGPIGTTYRLIDHSAGAEGAPEPQLKSNIEFGLVQIEHRAGAEDSPEPQLKSNIEFGLVQIRHPAPDPSKKAAPSIGSAYPAGKG